MSKKTIMVSVTVVLDQELLDWVDAKVNVDKKRSPIVRGYLRKAKEEEERGFK